MEQYVAFLRGINISGKNKIIMSELKLALEKVGLCNISTYLNSGNVAYSTDINDSKEVIRKTINDTFNLEIPVYVIKKDELIDIINNAPAWWGNEDKNKYDNLIFILSDDTPDDIYNLVGEPTTNLEKVEIYKNIIFWSFDRLNYQKCHWWKKTAANGIGEKLTIRSAATIKKIINIK